MRLATVVPYKFEKDMEGSDGAGNELEEKMDDDLFDIIAEEFLDSIFGQNSKVARKDYMAQVAQNQNWIFESKKVREMCEKKAKE